MGVPTFFRWLTMRNPKIVIDCNQPAQQCTQSPNPHIDNFYIDMNGLIHPSCNPQSQNIKIPTNFEQQCDNIFEYIDKIMNIVRPQKLIYLAIDGVAPRAKMNQQRSRRFRAAQQSLINQEKKRNLKKFYQERGIYSQQIQEYVNKKSFDSNVITPGTEFLSNISTALNYFIHNRMNTHPLWRDLIVIFSDANCPGQGQHKIMQFIRQQRACQNYCPNLSHCLYGADADLIMLGLMTHQPQFFIIRQTVMPIQQKRCTICGRNGHFFMNCSAGEVMQLQVNPNTQAINVEFQLISLILVRDQLHFNFQKSVIPYGYNLQRIVDDFIFMCFFVGNDFLPHLPSLNIRQGGIDVLLYLYQHTLYKMPDYLINAGIINYKSLQIFLSELSKLEDTLINQAIKRESKTRQRQQHNKMNQPNEAFKSKQQVQQYLTNPLQKFKKQLKEITSVQFNIDNYSQFSHPLMSYKQKFYVQKMRIQPKDFYQFRSKISQSYVQALSWICLYYYKGVASWSWHYPFHYSPFASDILISLVKLKDFELGTPFRPFQQLMAVFPAKTSWAIPEHLRWLMKDKNSPIADFFPTDFIIDVLGKKFAWLGEVLLPFIDQNRLIKAMGNYQQKLTQQQKRRNRLGSSLIFMKALSLNHKQHGIEGDIKIIPNKAQKIGGRICSPFINNWPIIQNNLIQCYFYRQPFGKVHSIQLKPGTKLRPSQVTEQYYQKTDRKSYNGEWMIRMIQRLIQKPKQKQPQNNQYKKGNPYNNLDQVPPQQQQDRRYNNNLDQVPAQQQQYDRRYNNNLDQAAQQQQQQDRRYNNKNGQSSSSYNNMSNNNSVNKKREYGNDRRDRSRSREYEKNKRRYEK